MSNKHPNGTEVRVLHSDGVWYDAYIVDCAGINKLYGWQYRCRIPELDAWTMKCHDGGKLEVKKVEKRHSACAPNLQQISKARMLYGVEALFGIRETLTATAIKQASEKMDRELLNKMWDDGHAVLRCFVEYRISEALYDVRAERDALRSQRDQLQSRNDSQAQQLGSLRDMVANREQAKAALSKGGWGVLGSKPGVAVHVVTASFSTESEAATYARRLAGTNTTTKYTVIALGQAFKSVEKQTVTREVQSV